MQLEKVSLFTLHLVLFINSVPLKACMLKILQKAEINWLQYYGLQNELIII